MGGLRQAMKDEEGGQVRYREDTGPRKNKGLRDLRSRNPLRIKDLYGALGRIRTCDTWLRRPVLYPLSYERVTNCSA